MTNPTDNQTPQPVDDLDSILGEALWVPGLGQEELYKSMREELKARLLQWGTRQQKVTGETSDGYHTFNELYHYRMLYNALWLNEVWWAESQYGGSMKPVKSKRHSDGELCFGGGWFVVSVQLPTGQVTNHYELKDWDKFRIPEVDKAPEWDGHTPQEAVERMEASLKDGGNDNG